jgi:hypothetical protein
VPTLIRSPAVVSTVLLMALLNPRRLFEALRP